MKLHYFAGAPNPRKVRIYLAEKGIENVEIVSVNLLAGEHRTPEFRKKNPWAALPVLELDDGTCRSESLAIIEYLEELHPDPPMIGTTPEERLRVRGLERMCDGSVLFRIGTIAQNSHPFFASRLKQSAEAAANARKVLGAALRLLDAEIGDRPFVAGDRPTIADCTLFAALAFANLLQLGVDLDEAPHVRRFYADFEQRKSANA